MRKLVIIAIVVYLIASPVFASNISAPPVPSEAEHLMPKTSKSFGEDLWYIIKRAIDKIAPNIKNTLEICLSIIAIVLIISIVHNSTKSIGNVTNLIAVISISSLLLSSSNTLIGLGVETIHSVNEYGKLLLPVMTASLAAEGGTVTSAALYTGTTLFNSILSSVITNILIPMLYVYIALCIASVAVNENILKNLKGFIKWMITWIMKVLMYIFTGYIGITGVISGSADAAAIKAAKLTISGMVPVVGSIISDASESILVGANVIKNATGVFGLLTTIAVCIEPFLKISIQYILLKVTFGFCSVYGNKDSVKIIGDFSSVMGFLLGMTGTVCLMLLISTVCFMKGVSS